MLSFLPTPENGLPIAMDSNVTSAASTSDQPTTTGTNRDRSEVSSVTEGSHVEEGGACEEEVDEEEAGPGEEEEEEEEEVDLNKWGPLRVPVTVKIADLGNACWVVSRNNCYAACRIVGSGVKVVVVGV